MSFTVAVSRRLILFAALLAIAACSTEELPPVPDRIILVSGDGQYYKAGEELPEPFVVEIRLADGSPAVDYAARFEVIEGDGTVSAVTPRVNASGKAMTYLTLGATNGPNRVRARIDASPGHYVEFTATGSDYYCREDDPTFDLQFPPSTGIFPTLYLATRSSIHNQEAGESIAGIVSIYGLGVVGVPPNDSLVFSALPVSRFTEKDIFARLVPWDLAFSRSGDLFMSWRGYITQEIMHVTPTDSFPFVGNLDAFAGVELTSWPDGIIVGCDEYGPFVAECGDQITRFPEATYAGTVNDYTNNDAVCTDPQTGDIYFIYNPDATLLRLPMSGGVPTGATEVVAQLTADQADGANSMEWYARDGEIYMLVDTDNTKAILKVEMNGTVTVLVDFFTRPDPGIQNELVVQQNTRPPFMYTIDTKNDVLLVWDGAQQVLVEAYPNSDGSANVESLSLKSVSGERVGLVAVPVVP